MINDGLTPRQPILPLTGLRFAAAGSVVIAHAVPMIVPLAGDPPFWYFQLTNLVGIGMTLFFVLSGFVIHYNYADKMSARPVAGTYNFFVSRFARLYPLYFACVAYDWLHAYSYSQLPESTLIALPYYLTMTQSWVYKVLGDHNLVYVTGVIVPLTWSISTEWFFYCTYPLICFALYRLGRARSVVLYAGAVTLAAIALYLTAGYFGNELNAYAVDRFGPVADIKNPADSFLRWLNYLSPYAQLPNFILGCFAADLYNRLENRPVSPREHKIGLALITGAAALILLTFELLYNPTIRDSIYVMNDSFPFGPPLAVLIFCCARYRSALASALSCRWAVFCGEVSYSIYLLHFLIILAFRWEAAKVTDGRVAIGNTLSLVVVVLAIIGLSYITYSIIESPARKWLTRVLSIPLRVPLPAPDVKAA